MKYWEHIIDNNLSFDKAREQIEKYHPYYATRPYWDGVHFYSKQGQYCILLNDGTVMINALSKDKLLSIMCSQYFIIYSSHIFFNKVSI